MPKLMIDLTGVEYDRLVAYAKTLRRTPQQQAAQLIADAMEELAAQTDRSPAPLEGGDDPIRREADEAYERATNRASR